MPPGAKQFNGKLEKMVNSRVLDANYSMHTEFKENTSIIIEPAIISDFEKYYNEIHSNKLKNNRQDFLQKSHILLQSLNSIFTELKSQTNDPDLICFFEELYIECKSYFEKEIGILKSRNGVYSGRSNRHREACLDDFKSKNYKFGQLDAGSVHELKLITDPIVSNLKKNAQQKELTRESLSVNGGSEVRKIVSLLNREFKKNGILELLTNIFQSRMVVSGVSVELSVPSAGWWKNKIDGLKRVPQTLYTHLDESKYHPKAILYLTDVEEKNGPTSCYPKIYKTLGLNPLQDAVGRVISNVGRNENSPLYKIYKRAYHQTANSPKFRQHYMCLPASIRFNSHIGWDVFPGSELERLFVSAEKKLIGKAGSFVIFNGGELFHRGGLIEEGHRVALQIVFSNEKFIKKLVKKLWSFL